MISVGLSLTAIVHRMEGEEETAFKARERAETPREREESARITAAESEIQADIPICRARELQRTFGGTGRAYAAAALV